MKSFLKTLKSAVILTILMAFLCSAVYPAVMTGLAQLIFKDKANGNLVYVDGELLAPSWWDSNGRIPGFFKGRISSVNYNVYTDAEKADGTYGGVASGSYNYGASNEELKTRVEASVTQFKEEYLKATGNGIYRGNSGRSADGVGIRPGSSYQSCRSEAAGARRSGKQRP